jgi:alpha-1,3-rhamnosyl/mannosyltransferase
MRIAVDTASLRAPFTGIANYQWGILEAALELGGAEFRGVASGRWHDIDIDWLRRVRDRTGAYGQGQSGPDRNASKLPRSGARRAVSQLWRRMPGAVALRGGYGSWRASAQLRSFAPDLFHAFNFMPPFRPGGVPVIPLVHDLSHLRHPAFHTAARGMALRGLEKVCALAPAVHTISKFSASEIHSLLGVPPGRVRVIPPAIGAAYREQPKLDAAVLEAFSLGQHGFALFVGALEPRKNLATLLAAYAMLPLRERRAMPLAVVGPSGWGGVREDARLAPLLDEGSVRMLGYASDRELATLYAAARVFVFPSHYEGFGMPVIEALACGAPVISSNSSAMPEAAGGHATLLAPTDVEAWRDALAAAIGDDRPLSPASRKRRRNSALARTWSDAARDMIAMYAECLRKSRG